MYRLGDYEFSLRELSGAMGDFGTLLPIAVGFIVVNGMHPTDFLVVFGVTNIVTGLIYRAPMPLQPMKAIAAVAIAGSWAPDLISATALSMGVFWLLLSCFSQVEDALKRTPESVIRGIQLALGISLGWTGLQMILPNRWWIGLAALGIIGYLSRGRRRNPAALVVFVLGMLIMLYDGTLEYTPADFALPSLQLPDPALAWQGMLRAGAGQIPLTLSNAVVGCAALLREYFPHRDISERRLMRNMGVMNVLASLFGGFPMCHGAGGLASQYYFGARTGGANILEGTLEILLGVVFGATLLSFFSNFPMPIIGAMMVVVGIELGRFSQTLRSPAWPAAGVTVALSLIFNLGVGFAGGLATELLIQRSLRGRNPNHPGCIRGEDVVRNDDS